MTKQEELEEWAFAFLRPICISDEHCLAYIHDFFRGLSQRGVVIRTERECRACKGEGVYRGVYRTEVKCAYCDGAGRLVVTEPLILERG